MSELITINSLPADEYQPYFQPYIDLAGSGDIRQILRQQMAAFQELYGQIDEPASQIVHAPYSWTIRQVVGHLIDGEKIFSSRALRIACEDGQPLPGFDQDLFVENSGYNDVTLAKLAEEFISMRQSNCLMFERFSDKMWQQSGSCDGKNISVRAIACVMAGHINHHAAIVAKRIEN